ncbi:glutathione peroxidase [Luethyella okanaganae]|uniref:Glutathione peroxidase n=1 Tax=Luethyella okanaganae TaxID=69372 RepID=A0ABW1VFJ9_9MICO
MNIREIPLTTIEGATTTLAEYADRVVLVVNVASKCGLTPQYAKLEALREQYGPRGLAVLGFPCNQFAGQEPGDAEKIQEFCSVNYGVTFPLFDKIKVNGRKRHPLYAELAKVPDAAGKAGRIRWNFEKFVIAPDATISRFRSTTEPDAPEILRAIESALPVRSD